MILQQTRYGQFFITMPKALVRAKGWTKGDYLIISINENGSFEIRKKKQQEEKQKWKENL